MIFTKDPFLLAKDSRKNGLRCAVFFQDDLDALDRKKRGSIPGHAERKAEWSPERIIKHSLIFIKNGCHSTVPQISLAHFGILFEKKDKKRRKGR